MNNYVIEIKNLFYTYPDGQDALKGVSLNITGGETIGIVGANGAGKSTLLLHLIGILFPTQGTIKINDTTISKNTLPQTRKQVGMVFQNPDDQLFMPTVYDDVAFGPINMGFSKELVDQKVSDALEKVGATHLADRPPYKLSGGQKKAVAIASILSMEPNILILDEPSAALDPLTRRKLINLLNTFQLTKIITSHDLDLVLDLCDRTIVLKEGQIIADGPSEEILSNEEIMLKGHLEKPLRYQSCGRKNCIK